MIYRTTVLLLAGLLALAIPAQAGKKVPREITVTATAYCPGPCKKCGTGGVTATGKNARKSMGVAVDPREIKMGRKITLLTSRGGVKRTYVADDTGGAIKGRRIDIRVPTHAEAKKFGKQKMKIRISK